MCLTGIAKNLVHNFTLELFTLQHRSIPALRQLHVMIQANIYCTVFYKFFFVVSADSSSAEDSNDNNASSAEDSNDNNDSSDDDRGDHGSGNAATHHGNQQPDAADGDNHHDNTTTRDASSRGESPGNRCHDDGKVDDDSYDGDESDYEEEDSSESSEEFFDCSNRFQPSNFPFVPRQRQSNRPIKSQTRDCPQWWESDGENIEETRLIRTSPPAQLHTCHHSQERSPRKPHPPIQVMVEQLHVMDIWGSDYFTDSFSEMSSESSCCEEDTGFEGGMRLPQRKQPVLIKQSPAKLETNALQNLTRMYSESPALTVPIQNGLDAQCACPYPQNTIRPCDTRVRPDWLVVESTSHPTSWVRKSSSEESWATANEDLELGTLV